MTDHRSIVELARGQHGLITLAQARAAGLSADAVGRLVRSGRWARLRRGVYVVGAAPQTWEQRILGACLAAGPDVRAAGRTAARLWDLVDRTGRPQVLVDGRRRVRLPDVTVHRTLLLPPMDRAARAGIPVTSLSRTLVDASAGQDPATVGAWVDRSIRLHGLELAELRSCLARLAGPGERDVRALREALELRPIDHQPGDSALEGSVLQTLRSAGLPEPVLQHPVRRTDGREAFIDAAHPWAMVALEADGFEFHRDRTAFDHDRIRSAELMLLGWDVYHLTSAMSDAFLVRVVTGALDRSAARCGVPDWRSRAAGGSEGLGHRSA